MSDNEELEAARDYWQQVFERLSADPMATLIERDLAIAALETNKHEAIPRSMPAEDSSPFRRMPETLLERRSVREGAKAVPHRVRGQIDVHVPRERAGFEPVEHLHRGLIEGQRHLEGKVAVDFEDHAHIGIENITGTRVNGARAGGAGSAGTQDVDGEREITVWRVPVTRKRVTGTRLYSLRSPSPVTHSHRRSRRLIRKS